MSASTNRRSARSAWSPAPVPASFSKARSTKPQTYLLLYGVMAALLMLTHLPLLSLPLYWDELGQFVPAALDVLHGHWIPQSTLPNVHPPGLMAWLGGTWL